MVDILVNTPLWVWALLAALIAFGVRSLRPTRRRLALLPLVPGGLLLWSAWTYFSGGRGVGPAAVWLIALLAGAAVGWRGFKSVAIELTEAPGMVLLPGSPLTLIVMLGIFACNYAVGVMTAMAPAHLADTPVRFGLPLVGGFCCGMFNGRAWRFVAPARPHHGVS